MAGRQKLLPFGKLERFGLTFANPVGLAAGFDKNGTAAQALTRTEPPRRRWPHWVSALSKSVRSRANRNLVTRGRDSFVYRAIAR